MQMTKKRIIYTIAVTLIVVFSTTFAILMTLERTDYRNYLQSEYSKNMHELITSVENIRVNLSKAAVTNSREEKIIIFEEIFRYSATANDKLHSLPIPQQNIESTSKFLSQVGDFCYSLVKASSEGKDLSDKDYNNIDNLKQEALKLQNDLNVVLADINEGRVKWGEIRQRATGVFARGNEEAVSSQFANIQKQIAAYPSLIYDGPFSDNIVDIKPKITAQAEVSVTAAANVVYKTIGKENIEKVENVSNDGKTKISSYRFKVTMKNRNAKQNTVICEISKNGGRVVYLLDNRLINNPTIDIKKAADIGAQYLLNLGYKNMVTAYSLRYDNTAIINYVYKQNDVAIYPDQIKLKIALDNGNIIGIESEKYLISHEENRKLNTPKISQADAEAKVSKRLSITTKRLAVIPSETNAEILCYEFAGNYKNDKFIVYINSQTGFEQRILQIINTPNGELTM